MHCAFCFPRLLKLGLSQVLGVMCDGPAQNQEAGPCVQIGFISEQCVVCLNVHFIKKGPPSSPTAPRM